LGKLSVSRVIQLQSKVCKRVDHLSDILLNMISFFPTEQYIVKLTLLSLV
jgi:hypothetical protein